MRKRILVICLLLIAGFSYGQVVAPWIKPNNSYGAVSNRAAFDSALLGPTGCGAPTSLKAVNLKRYAQYYDSCNHRFYLYDPKLNTWEAAGWGVNGNDIVDSNFIGTRNNKSFIVKTNNTERIRVEANGNTKIKDTAKLNNLSSYHVEDGNYEIIVFPDIQNMIRYNQAYSRSMFQWVSDSAAYYNIKAVITVGDLTDWNTQAEWDTLTAQSALLPSSMPILWVAGNHDYGTGFNPSGRDATRYKAFTNSYYSGKTWYKGNYASSNENNYISFDVGTKKYFALSLEFLPRDAVVTWASGILDSLYAVEPDREVIVSTHANISVYGELATDTSVYSGVSYGMSADNSGQELWDKLIKKKKNIKWVFSGHFLIPNEWPKRGLTDKMVSTGENGNLINQIYVDYQDDSTWGDGYMMRLKFKPATGETDVKVWSSYYNAFDARFQEYTLQDPSISVTTSLAVKGSAAINNDLRVAGEVKVESLNNKNGVVFTTPDHRLTTSDKLVYDSANNELIVNNKILVDTSITKFNRIKSAINGKTRVAIGGQYGIEFNDVFDVTQPTTGYLYKYGIVAGADIDSSHKFFLGQNISSSKLFRPANGFPSGSIWGANTYYPESSNSFLTHWMLKKGTYTIGGTFDYINANALFLYNRGGQEDSVIYNYGSNAISGAINIAARSDYAPGNSQYTTETGMSSNFVSYYKLTRKVNSEANWLNNYAVGSPGGADNGQIYKTMVGLYIEPMTRSFTRRIWGVLQVGTSEHNAFNGKLLIGDTAVSELGTNELYVNGQVRIKDGTEGAGKVLTSDANGNASWQAPSIPTEGTYTPTLTNTTNIASSTAYTTYYQRNGDVVHVWGAITIDATTAFTLSELGFSLPPIGTAVDNFYDIAGTAAFEDNTTVQIHADVANDRATFKFTPQSASANKYSFHFTIKWIAP